MLLLCISLFLAGSFYLALKGARLRAYFLLFMILLGAYCLAITAWPVALVLWAACWLAALPVLLRDIRQPWISRRYLQRFVRRLDELGRESDNLRHASPAAGQTLWWEAELLSGLAAWDRFFALPPALPSSDGESRSQSLARVVALCEQSDHSAARQACQALPAAALTVPADLGGWGLNHREMASWLFELAASGDTGAVMAQAQMAVCALGPAPLLLEAGSPRQCEKWLPQLVSGALAAATVLPERTVHPDDLLCGHAVVSLTSGAGSGERVATLTLNCRGKLQASQPGPALLALWVQLEDPLQLLPQAYGIPGRRCLLLQMDTQAESTSLALQDQHLPLECLLSQATGMQAWLNTLTRLQLYQGLALAAGRIQRLARQARQHSRADAGLEHAALPRLLVQSTTSAAAARSLLHFSAHALDLGERPAMGLNLAVMTCRQLLAGYPQELGDSSVGEVNLSPWARLLPPAYSPAADQNHHSNQPVGKNEWLALHPYLAARLQAGREEDYFIGLHRYDQACLQQWRRRLQLAAQTLAQNLAGGRHAHLPAGQQHDDHRRLQRCASRLALTVEFALAGFPRTEPNGENLVHLSQAWATLYLASAVLWQAHNSDEPGEADRQWICRGLFNSYEYSIHQSLRSLPDMHGWLARMIIMPLGYRQPRQNDGLALFTPATGD